MGCNVTPTRHAAVRFLHRGIARYMEDSEFLEKVDELYQNGDVEEDIMGIEGPRYRVRISIPQRRQVVTIVEKCRECKLKVITVWVERSS